MTRALTVAVCGLLVGNALGCSGSDRPEVAGDTASEIMSGMIDPAVGSDAGLEVALGEPGIPRRVCEPLTFKDCRIYYKDDNGIQQCPSSYQVCDATGRKWLPCGEYYVGQDGELVKQPVRH